VNAFKEKVATDLLTDFHVCISISSKNQMYYILVGWSYGRPD
jgi:hypothetical protein